MKWSELDPEDREALRKVYQRLLSAGEPGPIQVFERRYPYLAEERAALKSTEFTADDPAAERNEPTPSAPPSTERAKASSLDSTEYFAGEPSGVEPAHRRAEPPSTELTDVVSATAAYEEGTQDFVVDLKPHAQETMPEQLGDFRLIRKVGQGGMGIVYEAVQESLGRRVALKLLPGYMAGDRDGIRRFEREAKAVGRLHHTNIVPIFGVGREGESYYYVMQFIDGVPLSSVISELRRQIRKDGEGTETKPNEAALTIASTMWDPKRERARASGSTTRVRVEAGTDATTGRPSSRDAPSMEAISDSREALPRFELKIAPKDHRSWKLFARNVARVGVQAAEGLAHAHDQRILHRDIKPSNLMIDRFGTVWVTDFGLAKGEDSEDLTSKGAVVGTLRYVAPERFHDHCDVRSDVYALGLTLYELLAMRPAYDARDRVSLLRQLQDAAPPELKRLSPSVPRDLATIVHKAIDREPSARYQTAHELADDLNRFLEDRPIKARRLSWPERAQRWCRRNPTIAGLAALLFAVLTAGAIIATVVAIRFAVLAEQARLAAVDANSARRSAELTLADQYSFIGLESGRKDDPAQAALWFASALSKESFDPDRTRADEVRYRLWSDLAPRPVRTFSLDPTTLSELEVRPTGEEFLISESNGIGCRVWRPGAEEMLKLPPSAANSWVAAWSPDGTKLAWSGPDGLEVRGFPGMELIRAVPPSQTGQARVIAFGPGSDRIALARGDLVTVVDLDGPESSRVDLPPQGANVTHLVFGRRGDRLAVRRDNDTALVHAWRDGAWEPRGEPVACVAAVEQKGPHQPVFAQDDTRLVTISNPYTLTWWDFENGEAVASHSQDARLYRLEASPDGKTLIACDSSGGRIWDTQTAEQVGLPLSHRNYVYRAAYRADSKAVLTVGSDHVVRLWSVPEGEPLSPPFLQQDDSWHASLTPDGARFATGQSDGLIRLWEWGRPLVSKPMLPLEGGRACSY